MVLIVRLISISSRCSVNYERDHQSSRRPQDGGVVAWKAKRDVIIPQSVGGAGHDS